MRSSFPGVFELDWSSKALTNAAAGGEDVKTDTGSELARCSRKTVKLLGLFEDKGGFASMIGGRSYRIFEFVKGVVLSIAF